MPRMYQRAFAGMEEVELPPDNPRCRHAWHLYILRLNLRRSDRPRGVHPRAAAKRASARAYTSSRFRCIEFFARLPLAQYACPRALDLYPRIVSLPLYPAMTDEQVHYVAQSVREILESSRRAELRWRRGAPAATSRCAPRSCQSPRREMLMKNHRNIDVWLERVCHLAAVGLSVTAAFLLRFDFSIPASVIPILKESLLIAILVKLPIFDLSGFYRSLRRFVSIPDLYLVFLGNMAGSVLFAALSMFWIGPAMPRSVLIIDAVLCFVATALVRFSVRICNEAFVPRSLRA